jgi:hypothetical protein
MNEISPLTFGFALGGGLLRRFPIKKPPKYSTILLLSPEKENSVVI